jgi:hypothetical protein
MLVVPVVMPPKFMLLALMEQAASTCTLTLKLAVPLAADAWARGERIRIAAAIRDDSPACMRVSRGSVDEGAS